MQKKTRPEIVEILKKVRKLAVSGTCGESLAAKNLLDKIARKYGIDPDSVNCETRRFGVGASGWRLSLLIQLCAVVCGVDGFKVLKAGRRNRYEFECQEQDWLEIMAKFKILEKDYKDQLGMFYEAFLVCNGLTVKPKPGQAHAEPTPKDSKVMKLAKGLTKSDTACRENPGRPLLT